LLSLRGVLIDFGHTLAYIDEEEDTNYRKEIVTLLKKHGYSGSLEEFSPLLETLIGTIDLEKPRIRMSSGDIS